MIDKLSQALTLMREAIALRQQTLYRCCVTTTTADYEPEIPDTAVLALGLTGAEDAVLLSLVSVPEGDPQAATANLFAPVVINHHSRPTS